MKYVYICLLAISFLAGSYLGAKLWSRTELREVPVITTKEVIKLKQVVKYPDGKIVETEKLVEKGETKVSPQPKAQYRLGALLPIASELKLPTVTAGRRLFGNVWAEASFDIRHKEATIGVAVEF